MNAPILDPCCGSRMMHFDRTNPNVVFGDIRAEKHILCDGRSLEVSPDIEMDFRAMPFKDGQFNLVVFDPPHLIKAGKESWLALKYGKLQASWRDDIRKGFEECFRVLANGGVLIFKWNETQIKVSEILALTDQKPVFGHISGKRANTHWITFMKMEPAHMTNLQHIAQDLAEEFAPLVIGQSGTTKTFTAEQVSALYHILVGFGYKDECTGLDTKLPFELIDIKKEAL